MYMSGKGSEDYAHTICTGLSEHGLLHDARGTKLSFGGPLVEARGIATEYENTHLRTHMYM